MCICVSVESQAALIQLQLTCVFVCVCTSECVSLQPYLQIFLMKNYSCAALIFFLSTDNLLFSITHMFVRVLRRLSLTDEMKFQGKGKRIPLPTCALLRLVFTRLLLVGVHRASSACEHQRKNLPHGKKKFIICNGKRRNW